MRFSAYALTVTLSSLFPVSFAGAEPETLEFKELHLALALKQAAGALETLGNEPETRIAIQTLTLRTLLEGIQLGPAAQVQTFDKLLVEIDFGLKNSYALRLPRPQQEILRYQDAYRKYDFRLTERLYLFDLLSDKGVLGQKFRAMLKTSTPKVKYAFFEETKFALEKQSVKIKELVEQTVTSDKLKFKRPDDQRFFEILLKTYFTQLPQTTLVEVMKAVVDRPEQTEPLDLFKHLVLNAGPQMQKLLQIMGREAGFSPELRDIFAQLEEGGLATPWDKIKSKVSALPEGYRWKVLKPKAFTGTMAETYQGAVFDTTDSRVKVAIRTLKPGIREKVLAEQKILEQVAFEVDSDQFLRSKGFPLLKPLLRDILSMTQAELDVQQTLANQLRARSLYNKTITLRSGLTVEFYVPQAWATTDPDVILSEWVEGEKFSDFQQKNPQQALIAAEQTVRHWLETALFTGQFFHSDLHQGNLKILKVSDGKVRVGFLDFGMVGEISTPDRSTMLRLTIAAATKSSAQLLANYIWQLSSPEENQITLEQLTSRLVAKKSDPNFKYTLPNLLRWALANDIKLKSEITSFSRGFGAMEQLLVAAESEQRPANFLIAIAKKHPLTLAKAGAGYAGDRIKGWVDRLTGRSTPIQAEHELPLAPAPLCGSLF